MQKLPDVYIWTQEASLKRCSTPYPAQGGGGSGVYARNTGRGNTSWKSGKTSLDLKEISLGPGFNTKQAEEFISEYFFHQDFWSKSVKTSSHHVHLAMFDYRCTPRLIFKDI